MCWEKGASFSDATKAQPGPSVPQAGPTAPDSRTSLVLCQHTASPLSRLDTMVPRALAFSCSEQPC